MNSTWIEEKMGKTKDWMAGRKTKILFGMWAGTKKHKLKVAEKNQEWLHSTINLDTFRQYVI